MIQFKENMDRKMEEWKDGRMHGWKLLHRAFLVITEGSIRKCTGI